MSINSLVSSRTRKNWWTGILLFISGLFAALSGTYFLFFPIGGFRGGRNPQFGINILFDRHIWDDIHTWAGVVMVVIATIHLVIHWDWWVLMVRRMFNEIRGRCGCLNRRGRWNLFLNVIVATSYALAALSGIYFLFAPTGRGTIDFVVLFSSTTWDLIHTWSGTIFVIASVTHLAIHWRWITNITAKMARFITRAVATTRISRVSATN